MRGGVEVKVEGLADLRRKLRELPEKMDRRIVTDALRAGGQVVRAEAISRAPMAARPHKVGAKGKRRWVLPGNLKKAIRVSSQKSEFFASVAVGVRGSAFYWRFLEFGTRFIRPRPFMRQAFEISKEKALARIVERMKARIEAVAGGIFRPCHGRRVFEIIGQLVNRPQRGNIACRLGGLGPAFGRNMGRLAQGTGRRGRG